MRSWSRRLARILFAIAWLSVLIGALGLGVRAYAGEPSGLIAVGLLGYLGAWAMVFALSSRRKSATAMRWGACTGAVLLGWGLVESLTVLGLVDYRTVFSTPTPLWRQPGNRPDEGLVYVREGNRNLRWRFRGGDLQGLKLAGSFPLHETELTLDENGFRNDAATNAADVVVIGDSFAEGPHVASKALFSNRLETLTGERVVNLGRSGYGPQQELEVLRRYALPLKPKTCVWLFYEGNDLDDASRFEVERFQATRPTTRGSAWYERSFARNAPMLIGRRWLRPEPLRSPANHSGRFPAGDGTPITLYFGSGDYHPADLDAERKTSPGFRKTLRTLVEARDLCRANDIHLTVVFVPTKWRVYREFTAFEVDAACHSWTVDDLPEALRIALGTVDGFTYIDLTPTLRREAKAGVLSYLADDTHWSAEGHRIAAEAVRGSK